MENNNTVTATANISNINNINIAEGETEMEMEIIKNTKINITKTYTPTMEEAKEIKSKAWKLIDEYFPGKLNNGYGMDEMFSVNGLFWKSKGWLLDAFQKHPLYNGNYQIVINNVSMRRYVDVKKVRDFEYYVRSLLKIYTCPTYRGEEVTEEKYNELWEKFSSVKEIVNRCMITARKRNNNKMYDLAKAIRNKVCEEIISFSYYGNKYQKEMDIVSMVCDYIIEHKLDKQIFCSQELADKINAIIPKMAAKGKKLGKIVQAACKRTPIVDDVDIRDDSFYRHDGIFVQRKKDYGWKGQFPDFQDASNPKEEFGTAILSVNPIDFYTMSFGKHWASCHTIDKENRRGDDNNHEGCYCGGTESYMNDGSSIVFYFLPNEFKGNRPEFEDKLKRCMFFIGEECVVQSRVYPDGRDGDGEEADCLAKDIRELVLNEISYLFNVENKWVTEYGTSVCHRAIISSGVQYPDYFCYSDCNVNYLENGNDNYNKIVYVGVDPICPECGKVHQYSDSIFCEECQCGGHYCTQCGDFIREENVIWIDGDPYCSDCVEYCCNCDEPVSSSNRRIRIFTGRRQCVCEHCLENHYYWSEYDDCYIDEFDVVVTEEGNSYHYESDGYHSCARCGECHDADATDAIYYDSETNDWYCEDCYAVLLAEREKENDVA